MADSMGGVKCGGRAVTKRSSPPMNIATAVGTFVRCVPTIPEAQRKEVSCFEVEKARRTHVSARGTDKVFVNREE